MQKAKRGEAEKFKATGYRVGIVASRFNSDITEALLTSAQKMLKQYQVPLKNIKVLRVTGGVELPLALQLLAKTKKYNCLVAIGAVIKGETPHFEYVAKMATEGILRVMLDYSLPIGLAVLTTNNHRQAVARINVGGEAVEAAIQVARINKEIK